MFFWLVMELGWRCVEPSDRTRLTYTGRAGSFSPAVRFPQAGSLS